MSHHNGVGSSSSSSHMSTRPSLTILYASATGTASDLAHRLSRLAQRHHYTPSLHSLSNLIQLDSVRSLLMHNPGPVVFLVATAGNGSFPAAVEPLWQDILSAKYRIGAELGGTDFAIFGLGDSSYPKFCWPERMLRKRLVDLGATELLRAEGDEQHYLGIEGTYQPFLLQLFELLNHKYPLPPGLEVLPEDSILSPTLELRFLDEDTSTYPNGDIELNGGAADVPPSSIGVRWLRLVRNQRLTSSNHWQDVRQIDLEVHQADEADLEYQAGDIATLRPANDPAMVDALMARMSWIQYRDRPVGLFNQFGQRIHLPPSSKPLLSLSSNVRKDQNMTFHSYLVNYTSPFSPLRPSLFPLLRPFSPKGHLEREKLDEFCTPGDGYEDAMEYGVRTRRTIAEVLDEFQSITFEPRWAAEVFDGGAEEGEGGMREREFSIASGPSSSARSLTLLISLVSYKTRIREPRIGVLSRWLADLEPSAEMLLPVRIKKSSMLKLPPSEATPIIGIGPGTGMAPLRSLIQERVARARMRKAQVESEDGRGASPSSFQPFGPILLFFGCRSYPHSDALLHAEWSELAMECECKGLGKIYVRWASSRYDPATGKSRLKGEKEYVQDLVDQWDHQLVSPPSPVEQQEQAAGTIIPVQSQELQQGPEIYSWLTTRQAYVYVSGSSGNMPQQVRRAFERLVQEFGGLEEDQAMRFIDRMEKAGRWREECWS